MTLHSYAPSAEIPLGEWAEILRKRKCAFCRLVKSTGENVYGANLLSTEYQGLPVMVSMVTIFKQDDDFLTAILGPRQVRLWIMPDYRYGCKTQL